MQEMKYQIGDKIFVQKKLVLGQWLQLTELLKTVELPANLNTLALIEALRGKLFVALAIVLTEEGKSPKGKNLPTLAEEIEFGISPEDAVEAIYDFFELNPISSLSESITGMTEKLRAKMEEIGSMKSASSSAAETSLNGAGSSGM